MRNFKCSSTLDRVPLATDLPLFQWFFHFWVSVKIATVLSALIFVTLNCFSWAQGFSETTSLLLKSRGSNVCVNHPFFDSTCGITLAMLLAMLLCCCIYWLSTCKCWHIKFNVYLWCLHLLHMMKILSVNISKGKILLTWFVLHHVWMIFTCCNVLLVWTMFILKILLY